MRIALDRRHDRQTCARSLPCRSTRPAASPRSPSPTRRPTSFGTEVEAGKQANVIYIGDYDPAGVLIDRSIEAELCRHLQGIDRDDEELRDQLIEAAKIGIFPDLPRTIDLQFHRLAITEEQIAEFDLPTKPRKATDRRAQHVKATVEAEAMPAATLRDAAAAGDRGVSAAGCPGGRPGGRGIRARALCAVSAPKGTQKAKAAWLRDHLEAGVLSAIDVESALEIRADDVGAVSAGKTNIGSKSWQKLAALVATKVN